MNWQMKQGDLATTVVLEGEMWILHAADFHQAMLPLAGSGGAVRIDASAVKSIHSSIVQILYALSQAVPDFGVTEASEDFCAAEVRVGLSFARTVKTGNPANLLERS
jgi:ABC-type transporter Mla MlaB component